MADTEQGPELSSDVPTDSDQVSKVDLKTSDGRGVANGEVAAGAKPEVEHHAKLSKKKAKVQRLKELVRSSEEKANQASQARQAAEAKISNLTLEKDALQAEYVGSQNRLKEIEQERKEESVKTRNFRSAKETAIEGENRALQSQLRDAAMKLLKLRELKDLQQKLSTADEKYRDLNTMFIKEQRKSASAQEELSKLRAELDCLTNKGEKSTNGQEDTSELKEQLANSQQEVSKLRAELHSLTNEGEKFANGQEEALELKEQLANSQQEVSKLRAELHSLTNKGEKSTNGQEETSELKEQLANSQEEAPLLREQQDDKKLETERLEKQLSTPATTPPAGLPANLRARKSKKGSGFDDSAGDVAEDKDTTSVKAPSFSSGILSVLVAVSVGSSVLSFYVTKRIYQ